MRIGFIGCVEFSESTLKHLLTLKDAEVVGIVTLSTSTFNSDFKSLTPVANSQNIPCFYPSKENGRELIDWLTRLNLDVIYCFGWSQLLKSEILEIPRLGVIGYHPAALPQNRGRHPLIWALALGLNRSASTFFFMDEGADSGDILSQREFEISENDDAKTLYAKVTTLALLQISEFTNALASGRFEKTPQDSSQANTWRKREASDGKIDWRMSTSSIHNLVRALTTPYVGAHCDWQNEDVKIWKVEKVRSTHSMFANIEPGKVLEVGQGIFKVKCGDGVIEVLKHEFKTLPQEGDYL